MLKFLQRSSEKHGLFGLILLLFVVFRLLSVLLFRPGGFIADASDYDFYMVWGQLTPQGYRAYENLWTAYPPLFPLVMLTIFEWSSRIPPWLEPRLFFHTLFGLTLLMFEAGNLILIYRLALRLDNDSADYHQNPIHGQQIDNDEAVTISPQQLPALFNSPLPTPLVSALLYALLFTPVYTMLGWFEPMPLFFLLLSLDLLLISSRLSFVGSAIAAALGFLTKLTPILLLPVAVRWMGSRLSWQAARDEWFKWDKQGNLLGPVIYAVVFATVVLAIAYPVVRNNPQLAFTSLQIQGLRPAWQSVWALIEGNYGFGMVPIDMRNLVALDRPPEGSPIPWTAISLLFGAVYVWLYTRPYAWTMPRTPVAFTALSVIMLFLYSKGWSPQFLVWILAFMVLLLPTWRGMVVASLFAVLNVIESHIFLVLLPDESWILWITVISRTVLLTLLALEFATQIWRFSTLIKRLRLILSRMTWAVAICVTLLILFSIPRAARAYTTRMLSEHPCADAIDYLESQVGWPNYRIVSDQIDVWRDFHPWLRDLYSFHIIDTYSPSDEPAEEVALERLSTVAAEGEFWWVMNLESSTSTHRRDSAALFFSLPSTHIIESQQMGRCTLQRVLSIPESNDIATADVAGGPIKLVAIHSSPVRVGQHLYLVLYWQALGAVDESYTVFTHLVDEEGALVAQQDNLPVNGLAPTDSWQIQSIVRDPYLLQIPKSTAAGQYQLQVGLYRDDRRVTMHHSDGLQTDAVTVEIEIDP